MTFSLTIDRQRFEKNLNSVIADFTKVGAKIIPVVKGNGYGFGRKVLASQAQSLGLSEIAIGTVFELEDTLSNFSGEVLVLEPFNPADLKTVSVWKNAIKNNESRVTAVISGPYFEQAANTGIRHVLVEAKTSVHRFGVELGQMLALLNSIQHGINIKGMSFHLPIVDPINPKVANYEVSKKFNSQKISSRLVEIATWLTNFAPVVNSLGRPINLNLSHVSSDDVRQISEIAKNLSIDVSISVRLGTSLWLGDAKSLVVRGTVLEIHELTGDHEHIGYRQIDSHGNARLLVVSGGTTHGVALAAPITSSSLRVKGIALAEGIAQAIGKVRSPFKLNGKNLPFAESPHMHVSLLWCEDRKVKVGDQLECNIRNTTANFDLVEFN